MPDSPAVTCAFNAAVSAIWPPAALVRRLADESVDIAAPLLIRSKVLSDVDLIALIGRHGYEITEWRLREGRCTSCGTPCAGVFEDEPGRWGSRRMPVKL